MKCNDFLDAVTPAAVLFLWSYPALQTKSTPNRRVGIFILDWNRRNAFRKNLPDQGKIKKRSVWSTIYYNF